MAIGFSKDENNAPFSKPVDFLLELAASLPPFEVITLCFLKGIAMKSCRLAAMLPPRKA
jgi:hypothetical protein